MADDTLLYHLLLAQLAEGGTPGNLARYHRLSEGRLVGLVVALTAIAIHVDDHITSECLAELECEDRSPVEIERLLAIDVENGCLNHLGHIGRVI